MTTASADVPLKGLVSLLEALAKLRTEQPEAHLVVVGQLREDSPVHATLDRLGLRRGGPVRRRGDRRAAGRPLRRGRLRGRALPLRGLLAPGDRGQACGTPLVATTGGALPEVAGTDGEHVLLVPPGDPGALALAVGRLLEDPVLAARLGERGRRRALARFSWTATARGTAEQYGALLEAHRSRAPSSC